MKILNLMVFATVIVGLMSHASTAALYSDNFNSAASSANYTVATSDATSSFATFNYNYLADKGIPSAPSSGDGSTKGVRLDANFSAPNVAESITLHTLQSFSGKYTVTFDAWINVNGDFPDGGSGSTNYLTGGVGGDGTTNNRGGLGSPPSGKGGWFAVNGDNGNGTDYRLHKDATLQTVASGQYAAGSTNGTNAYYNVFGGFPVDNFPVQGAAQGGPAQQTGTTGVGTFGMAWHRVKLVVNPTGGTGGAASVKWFADGLLLGTLDAGANGAFSPNGKVTLGYSDPSNNLSDNPPYSFVVIDNLTVVPEPTSLALGCCGLIAIAARRAKRTGR